MSVTDNFQNFCNNLLINEDKRETISSRYDTICKRLNKDFWNMDNTNHGGKYIGSFGRKTANSYVSDIDMLFEMPLSIYNKYNTYISNGQSALLQAVKNSISTTYPFTTSVADGQVVVVTFSDGMKFEVLPAFKNSDESYIYADSNNGGSWKKTDPIPEINAISTGDYLTNKNLKRLCRMARAWKYYNSVPINGLLIDTLAYRFLINWGNRDKSYLYYDFMSRDFFDYLKNQDPNQTIWYAVGSGQSIYNAGNFRYKATLAYNKALEAIQQETNGQSWSSKQKWRDIYGYRFPS